MSLEIAIQNLADAINNLARNSGGAPFATASSQVHEDSALGSKPLVVFKEITPAPKRMRGTTCAEAEADVIPGKKNREAETVEAESAVAVAKEYDYEKDIAPALTKFLKTKGREAGVALLAKYGAKNGQGVKAEDYAAFMADMAA